MRIKARYIMLSVFTIAVLVALLLSFCLRSNPSDNKKINEDVIQTKGFILNSQSTELNTAAFGTVFIKGANGIPDHIQIIAYVEIDPVDWGGVAFYIPDSWYISNIVSSYPDNQSQSKPVNYVSTWTTEETKYNLNKVIEIGRDHSYKPTGGGTGSVIIDLFPEKNALQQSETFNIAVAIGSDVKDGIMILEPDSILLEIPINKNKK
jgi:hypothetical protein